MTILTPYLSFNGNCKEAMEFYKSALGGELNISLVGDSPMAAQMPGKENWVMHSELKANGLVLMASDIMMGDSVQMGTNVTLTLSGGTKEEIEGFFNKLSEGGKITQPFQETFFGFYGGVTDKYGFNWGFQADKPQG